VIVFMLDRFGRDSIERQQRGKEFDRLGVPLISCLEGPDQPGVLRAIRAELSEEESRRNAQRVTPNRERAAREGWHVGSTPYGYRREFPAWDGTGRRPAGTLVPKEPDAGEVRQMFARYATGQWSTVQLAADLNARGVPPARPKRQQPEPGQAPSWKSHVVHDILTNPSYVGMIRYNRRPSGHYQRAPAGSAFTVEGKHAPLVDQGPFERVQERLAAARKSMSVARNKHTHLLAGLLRCGSCCGLMNSLACGCRSSAKSSRFL
jgi:DNA invertase Pin-like site-specific DNA recombinase